LHHRLDIRSERGQAMVEFAFVLPVLMVILLAIVQFGIAFNNYVTLTDAVRAGGRQASVGRFAGSDPVGATTDKVLSSAAGLTSSDIQVTVTNADGTTPVSWTHGNDVTVTATYPYDINLLGIVVASGHLSSSATEKVE
jgi:Flp pilus assembly protein TadG